MRCTSAPCRSRENDPRQGACPTGLTRLPALCPDRHVRAGTLGHAEVLCLQVLEGRRLGLRTPTRYANKAAAGVTYTTRSKLSLTMEYEYNGWVPDLDGWTSLRQDTLANYTRYRTLMRDRLDLPTRRALFFYGTWEDAGLQHLDLTLMRRYNIDDRSGLVWLEGRNHWKRADLALQFQYNGGAERSEYGALPDRRRWQLVSTFYF